MAPVYLRRLTREQYRNTIRDLLGADAAAALPPDERVGAFFSNSVSPVTELGVEEYLASAERIAAAADLDRLLPCDVDAGDDACARRFIEELGLRAYRRPPTEAEASRLFGVFEVGRSLEGFAGGVRLSIQSMLSSPSFLYRGEFGVPEKRIADAVELSAFELASRLSYFLWNTMPDAELLELARADRLLDPAILGAQARRMIDDPRSRDAVGSFHTQWLNVSDLDATEKDREAFPWFNDAARAAMQRDVASFANYVIQKDDGRLETLLTAPYAFPEGALFAVYGVAADEGYDGSAPVVLDPARRAGILTQAGVLAAHAHPNQTSPVRRGLFVRSNLLCQNLPPAPPDVDNVPPDPDPNTTTRERLDQHRTEPRCAGCHQLMDPVGFGFEHYDAAGVYRSIEADLPVDASGEILLTADINGPFDGAIELAGRLAQSQEVRACVPAQWFRYAFGHVEGEGDACSLETIRADFAAAEYDLRDLIVAITTTDAFRYQHASAARPLE